MAGVHPPVYRNVRVYREVRLPRLMPRKQRMNLRLEHEQQAEVEATFHPVLEDDSLEHATAAGALHSSQAPVAVLVGLFGWLAVHWTGSRGLAVFECTCSMPSPCLFVPYTVCLHCIAPHAGTCGWPSRSSSGRLTTTTFGRPASVRPPTRCCSLPVGWKHSRRQQRRRAAAATSSGVPFPDQRWAACQPGCCCTSWAWRRTQCLLGLTTTRELASHVRRSQTPAQNRLQPSAHPLFLLHRELLVKYLFSMSLFIQTVTQWVQRSWSLRHPLTSGGRRGSCRCAAC